MHTHNLQRQQQALHVSWQPVDRLPPSGDNEMPSHPIPRRPVPVNVLKCLGRCFISSEKPKVNSLSHTSPPTLFHRKRWQCPSPEIDYRYADFHHLPEPIRGRQQAHATSPVAPSAAFYGPIRKPQRCSPIQRHDLCTCPTPSAGTSTFCLPQNV